MTNMATKKEYLDTVRKRYRSLKSRSEKRKVINEVVSNLKVHEKHAIRTLNQKIRRKIVLTRRRPEVYGFDLIKPLKEIWVIAGKPRSKRLKPQLPELMKKLEQFNEIKLYPKQKDLLLKIGTSSIDKLLGPEKRKLRGKGLTGTKRSPLLKSLIPIRTGFDDVKGIPGHIEMDTVLHCGDTTKGNYAITLNNLDIDTHWNEKGMFFKKTQDKVIGSFVVLKRKFPFEILSVDFDGGDEFVNWKFKTYCDENHTAYTRCRSYHKNDQAHIESKNFQSIRKVIGYDRITDLRIIELIDDIYQDEHRLLTNFFYTTLKLSEKKRVSNKIKKKYEIAKTPYQRVLESKHIDKSVKEKLQSEYEHLNPAQLSRSLNKKLDKISKLISVTKLNQATP